MSEKKYYGIYQGVVTNINDPEKRGRIRVICPDVLGGETESAWCEPVVTVAYDNGGDFCLPTKDETVWIQFIAGDSNRPVYLGGWWQKEKTPLGANYSNIDKVRIIKYADCTITMQNGIININTGGGAYDLQIQNGQVTVAGNLTVTGTIYAPSIRATSGARSGGSIITDTLQANQVATAPTINATTVNATDVSANNVSASSDVTASGISLKDHTHGGVNSGSDKTDTPS